MSSILITGGTGNFGQRFIRQFLSNGWTVLFTSTSQTGVDKLLDEHQGDERLYGFVADFTEDGRVSALVDQVLKELGPIEHLINNARSLDSLKIGDDGVTVREHFLQEFLLDVIAPYELSMAFAKAQPYELKTIVNIGSMYGLVAPNPKLYEDFEKESPIQYGVSKAALVHLTKELAVRLANDFIRVNCIAYGGEASRVDQAFAGSIRETYTQQ